MRARRDILIPMMLAILALVLTLPFVAGCGTETFGDEVSDTGFLAAKVDRSPSSADDGAVETLVEGNNSFGLELFRAVRTADQNLVCSPYGLSTALAMTLAGATGETEQEMIEVLRFGIPQSEVHPAFNSLDQRLSASGQLQIANALWGSDRFAFNQSFVDLLAREYGAGLALLDFDKSEEAAATINSWVDEKTQGRIPELVAAGDFSPESMLLLIDALHFKADWETQFDEQRTQELYFHPADGTEVRVPMMRNETDFPNGRGSDFQALELPYADSGFSMLFILPAEGAFEEFVAGFDAAKLAEVVASLQENQIDVLLPRFEFSSEPQVQDGLKSMGMSKMFGGNRDDFYGMLDESKGLPDGIYVEKVVQKAFISVGEEGTEAAAATGVMMMAAGIQEEHNEIILNRPFLYLIRDTDTGQVMFIGQVIDPSKAE